MTATIEDVLAGRARWTVEEGDCLAVMDAIPDGSVDMILCDLPYGTTACKWDVIIPFESLWKQYKRIAKDETPILLFATEPFSSSLRGSNIKQYRYDWYWNKRKATNFLQMNHQPGKVIENICVFYERPPLYIPQKILNPKGIEKRFLSESPRGITSKHAKEITGENSNRRAVLKGISGNYEPEKLLPLNLLEFSKDMKGRLHPTQKPVALMEYLIKTYSNEGELILDNCSGSGSTLVAALNTGRRSIGIEKEPQYVTLSRERLQAEEQKARQLEFAA